MMVWTLSGCIDQPQTAKLVTVLCLLNEYTVFYVENFSEFADFLKELSILSPKHWNVIKRICSRVSMEEYRLLSI